MKITYDPKSDAIYIKLNDHEIAKTKSAVENKANIDLTAEGVIVGIELLWVSDYIDHPDQAEFIKYDVLLNPP